MTREQLLDAAFKLFAAGGYAATSLTDVASFAGVGRTTVYEYFSSKEELYLELIADRVPPRLSEAMAGLPPANAADSIEQVFRASFGALEEHLDLAHVLFIVGRELPAEARERMWQSLHPASDELRRQCRRGVDEGVFHADNVDLLFQEIADLLVGGIDQMLALGDFHQYGKVVLESRVRFLRGGMTA